MKVRGAELKYPRPDNLVTLGKEKFEAGENVCSAYNTTSPIYKLNALINLTRAQGSKGKKYFEKEAILVSDCYAFEDGTIHYSEDDHGNIIVTIGEREYLYNPECMYYFPDGATVRKYDRICSGVVDMGHVTKALKNINDVYMIFRKQLYDLTDGNFTKTGISDEGGTQEEIIELLFAGLTRIEYDEKDETLKQIEYQGVRNATTGKSSFYTLISYGWAGQAVGKALRGEADITNDLMTSTVLGLLTSGQI